MANHYPSFALFIMAVLSCHICISARNTAESNVALSGECETIRIASCQKLVYNETLMPNYLGHTTQDEAAEQLHQFAPIFRLPGCHSAFRIYMCLQYAPICTVSRKIFPPCRSVCEEAQEHCEPAIIKSGLQWESLFNCDSFPSNASNIDEPCIGLE